MAIEKYCENGQTFWKVYVHVRSKTNRTRRLQKRLYRLKTETEARREEKKLTLEFTREIQRLDCLGSNWDDVVTLWYEEIRANRWGRMSKRSADGYLSILNKWTTLWNLRPAAQLTKADGRNLLIRLDHHNLSRAYQKKVKNIINNVFDWGIQFGHIFGKVDSPLKGLYIERKEEKVPEILSLEEIRKFLSMAKSMEHRWYPVWSFAVLTGMRSGELHALTWEQIDMEKNIIRVDRSYDSNTKSVGLTKGRYWRTIPINEDLQLLIGELKSTPELLNSEFVLPRIKDWNNGDQAAPLRNFLKSIKVKSVKFHALRACFATQMLASGVPAPIVMKIGGWKKSATMDIYLRLAGVDTKGATDCLQFTPQNLNFGENVVELFNAEKS